MRGHQSPNLPSLLYKNLEKRKISAVRNFTVEFSQKGLPSSVTVVTLLCVSCSIVVCQLLYYCVTVVTQVGLPVTVL